MTACLESLRHPGWNRLLSHTARRDKLEALFDVAGLEAENLFDTMLIHGDETDAVRQTKTSAPQVHPDLLGFLANDLVGAVNIYDSQDVLAPQPGGSESETVLQHVHGFQHREVAGDKGDAVLQ